MTKQLKRIRITVKNVSINGEAKSVTFVAKNGRVMCRSKGLPTITIATAAKGKFASRTQASGWMIGDRTPAKAFASAVTEFWN